jgi:hypothetical protein
VLDWKKFSNHVGICRDSTYGVCPFKLRETPYRLPQFILSLVNQSNIRQIIRDCCKLENYGHIAINWWLLTVTWEWLLNFLASIALFTVGIVPIFIALRVKVHSLRIMSLLLGLFAITHAFYHLAEAYGIDFASDIILEPISVIFLLAFGLYYSKKGIM